MNEIKTPEQKKGKPPKSSLAPVMATEATKNLRRLNEDTGLDITVPKNKEGLKKQIKDVEGSIAINKNVNESATPESEINSRFSRENFQEENSFDARAKINYPELTKLKSKCVYDVAPMGTSESKVDRTPKGTYTQVEREYIKKIREGIDAPTYESTMQKVISVDTGNVSNDLRYYLNPKTPNGEAQVFGFVSKAEDAAPFTQTPQACHDNMRLDYSGTQYTNPDQSVYVIRFTDGENYNIPYSKEFGGSDPGLSPFTGNGFISAKDVTVPEYTVAKDSQGNGAIVTDGGIYRINPDGTEELVAYYDDESRRFKLYERGEEQ